ncbi:MAG: ABC-2 transporter permease [Roseburia sp.]|nr:ABC-2 transporter permease [Roseburia sp.]MCM1242084.1 ABC-2 transporter permease [Roseburia sp.]
MKGLIRNNLYATYAGARVFSGFMLLLGIFTVAVISQSLQIGYVMIGIIGFSANAIAIAKNEFGSKWGKYKLTLPVKRVDIIKSLYCNQLIWLLAGVILTGIELCLSWLLHGCPFDQPIDILSLFALGVSMSLFTSAIFFPLFYLGGEEKSEAFLIIALLCAFGLDLTIVTLTNELLSPGIVSIVLGNAVLTGCSVLAFIISYPLTVHIFRRKEY